MRKKGAQSILPFHDVRSEEGKKKTDGQVREHVVFGERLSLGLPLGLKSISEFVLPNVVCSKDEERHNLDGIHDLLRKEHKVECQKR